MAADVAQPWVNINPACEGPAKTECPGPFSMCPPPPPVFESVHTSALGPIGTPWSASPGTTVKVLTDVQLSPHTSHVWCTIQLRSPQLVSA